MKVHQAPQLDASEYLDADALIEEARQRQRRRWLFVGIVVLIVAVGSGVWAAVSRGRTSKLPTPSHATTVPITPSATRSLPLPVEFVAAGYSQTSPPAGMTAWGTGLVVASTKTGRVLRVLARGRLEVLARQGNHVFFVQLPGNEFPVVYEVSISGGPVRRIAPGSSPTPSPNGDLLAYLSDTASRLEVLDLGTRTTTSISLSALAPRLADPVVAGLAWASPGSRLAALVRSNAAGPVITQLIVLDVQADHHLAVVMTRSFPSSMNWTFLYRSSTPGTLLGGWDPTNGPDVLRVVQLRLLIHGVSLREVGSLPASCGGALDAIDQSAQHVLCSVNPLYVVSFEEGRYRVASSISDSTLVITSATW